MFESILLAGPQSRSIVLQTHLGTDIQNEIALHPVPEHAQAKFDRLHNQHPNWQLRKPATGIYNCFGHVWASRRTAVYDNFDEYVLKVRNDDGYRVIDWRGEESPCPGDVACYWEQIDPYQNCFHVGRVVQLVAQAKLPPAVFVLSKWDDTAGEVVHQATDYPKSFGNSRLEYWTDRPASAPARKVLQ